MEYLSSREVAPVNKNFFQPMYNENIDKLAFKAGGQKDGNRDDDFIYILVSNSNYLTVTWEIQNERTLWKFMTYTEANVQGLLFISLSLAFQEKEVTFHLKSNRPHTETEICIDLEESGPCG